MADVENARLLNEVARLEQELIRVRADRDMYRLQLQQASREHVKGQELCPTPVDGTPLTNA